MTILDTDNHEDVQNNRNKGQINIIKKSIEENFELLERYVDKINNPYDINYHDLKMALAHIKVHIYKMYPEKIDSHLIESFDRVTGEKDEWYEKYCPRCHNKLEDLFYCYCPYCGQMFDNNMVITDE